MNVLHLEENSYSEYSKNRLLRAAENVKFAAPLSQQELREVLAKDNYEAIFTSLGFYFGQEEFLLQQDLKFLITPTTGLNHIDLQESRRNNVTVLSLKYEKEFLKEVQSTSEHTWGLLLSLIRNIKPFTQNVEQGGWSRDKYDIQELNTKTLGIIGYGRLGRIVAKYGLAFNMNILINDTRDIGRLPHGVLHAELDELLSNSDYILLLADYSDSNINMISLKEFELMKEDAFFVNCSRGEMVDENALLYSLKNQKIAGAALDVLVNDSSWKRIPDNNPLLDYMQKNNNLLITPHIGGYGRVSIEKTRDYMIEMFLKKVKK